MKNLILLITALFAFTISEAQIVDRTKERAKSKATNRVDRKIDNGIDKGLDAIEGVFKKKDKSKKESKSDDQSATQEKTTTITTDTEVNYSGLFGGGKPLDMDSEYEFDHQVLMQMTTFDKKGKQGESMNMTMLFPEGAESMGMEMSMEGAQSYMVMDMDRKKSVVLTDMQGMKVAMEVDHDEMMYEETEVQEVDDLPSFSKTGKTKKILGYNCEQYVFSDDDMEGEMWMTEEVDLDMYKGFQSMMATNKQAAQLPEVYPAGMMMETISTDKKSGEKMVMVVRDIKMNAKKTISTEGYSSMGFGGN